jgi:hypothetical protein
MIWQLRRDHFVSETGKALSCNGNKPQDETMPALTRLVGPGTARRSS